MLERQILATLACAIIADAIRHWIGKYKDLQRHVDILAAVYSCSHIETAQKVW